MEDTHERDDDAAGEDKPHADAAEEFGLVRKAHPQAEGVPGREAAATQLPEAVFTLVVWRTWRAAFGKVVLSVG